MNKRYLKTLLIAALVLLAGCKTGRKAMENGTAAGGERLIRKEKDKSAFHREVEASRLDFDWFSARGKASIATGSMDHNVTLNLRMQKDEVIWASVTAFLGLEMARALITPDSVKFFNRLERTYVSQSFDYLKEYVHPGISFELLEAALTGNTPAYLLENGEQLWQIPDGYRLEGMEKVFSYMITFSEKYKTEKIFIREQEGRGNFNIDYGNFENRSGKSLPTFVGFSADAAEKDLKIQLTYDTFTLDEPLNFPFEVPGRYKRMQ